MDWDIFFKAIGILVTLILGIAQIRSKHPTQALKDELKDDLEILSKLKEGDFGYDIIKSHIKVGILATYSIDRKRWYHVYNWDDLLIGASIAGIFTYWTLILIETSNLWGFLTALLAVTGFAMIPDAFQKDTKKDKD
ncbi:hypothetical protein [Litoribrevibacter albus]|uniref:Uncharacterized protein n=1 Tax=Litoribrevibacter albus TaxID=1473156 RepID=A0AA37W9F4_9GAMM|nr:hypothetical protein [Litoribrevibacter albus]GLQ33314.1 hypothetical protein GCM10007876_37940 [Litoribrevibacter albus]